MARTNVVQLRLKPATKRKPSRRKKADEWRALNRSHKVKDGRAVLLAIKDPLKPGQWITGQGYWCARTKAWWWANCAAGVLGCDPIADILDLAGACWMPMPAAPLLEHAA
jgi:hypothetical protein